MKLFEWEHQLCDEEKAYYDPGDVHQRECEVIPGDETSRVELRFIRKRGLPPMNAGNAGGGSSYLAGGAVAAPPENAGNGGGRAGGLAGGALAAV